MEKKVLITGASRGIGRAIALAFSEEGNRLFLSAKERTEALLLVQKEAQEKGAFVSVFTGDLSEPSVQDALFQAATDFFGTPDILIHNAGQACTGLFQDMDDAALTRVIHTDLLSVLLLTRRFLPGMIKRQSGKIISLSSVYGETGASCEVAYSAAKGGISAFTKALAKELAPSHISVNAVAPGYIDTDMNAALSLEERQALTEEIPAGRAGTPEEVAALVRFLSEAPEYLTGQVIKIDGGWT